MKKLFLFIIITTPFSLLGQNTVQTNEYVSRDTFETTQIASIGTYQIFIKSIKDLHELSESSLKTIENLRDQNSSIEIILEGYKVLVMSKNFVDQGIRWTKYQIENK